MYSFKEIIKFASQNARLKFIDFIKGIYDINECVFEHLLSLPIISPYDEEFLNVTPLSTKSEDDIIEILGKHIERKLQDNYICHINLNELSSEFDYNEIEEWENKLTKGQVIQSYHFIIGYNEVKLRNEFEQFKHRNQNLKIKELETKFSKYVTNIILYEICNLNFNYLEYTKSNSEVNNKLDENNEILIKILVQMINSYKAEETLEDCLYKVIKQLKDEADYQKNNVQLVLTVYTIFVEELTQWAMFGGYKTEKTNKLNEKIVETIGINENIITNEVKPKVCEYILNSKILTGKQSKILKTLGYKS